MLNLDLRTLGLANLLIATMQAAALLLFMRGVPIYPGMGRWTAASICFVLSIVSQLTRDHLPPPVAIIGGNTLPLVAKLLIADGLARFLDRPSRRWDAFAIALLVAHQLITTYFSLVENNIAARIGSFAFVGSAALARSAWLLWRHAPPIYQPFARIGAVCFSVTVLWYTARIVDTLHAPQPLSIFAPTLFQTGTVLLFFINLALWTLLSAGLIGMRLMDDLRRSANQNSELYRTAQRQARDLELIDRVRIALMQDRDLSTLVRTVVEQIAKTFRYRDVQIAFIEGEEIVLQHHVGQEGSSNRQSIHVGVLGRVARTGQPALVKDIAADPDFIGMAPGVTSELAVPLFDQGRVVGVLNIESGPDHRLDESDLRLVQTLGQSVSIAIERARRDSEQRQAEELVRFQKIMLECLTETSLDGIIVVSPERRWLLVNRRFMTMWNLPDGITAPVSSVDSLRYALSQVAEPERFIARIEELYGRPEARAHDTIALRDGRVFERYTAPVQSAEGVNYGRAWFYRDVTDQARAEAALRETHAALELRVAERTAELRRSNLLLHTLFDGLNSGLLLLDADSQILAANRVAARILGRSPDALTGRCWSECSLAGHAAFAKWVLETLADGEARRRQERVTAADGPPQVLEISTLPIRDEALTTSAVIVHIEDATERLQIEARALANERFAASGKLATTIAHEINTPLQTLQSVFYLVRNKPPADRERYLTVAQQETERITRIVRQLLDLYRPASSRGRVDLSELIDRVLILVDPAIRKQHIAVERSFAPDIRPALGYADQLTQVLLNLVVNAVQAMPRGGTLRLETSGAADAAASQVVVRVQDTGGGIPRDQIARIFAPFYTTRPEGTGLGLALCAQIVAEHDGQISVESEPGSGATFTVTLPAAPQDAGVT